MIGAQAGGIQSIWQDLFFLKPYLIVPLRDTVYAVEAGGLWPTVSRPTTRPMEGLGLQAPSSEHHSNTQGYLKHLQNLTE